MARAYVLCVIFSVYGVRVSSSGLTCRILEVSSIPCVAEKQRCSGMDTTNVNQYGSEAQPRPQVTTLLPRVTSMRIDPYQRSWSNDFTGTLHPGVTIYVSIDTSRINDGMPGVELSFSKVNGSSECITMTTRTYSLINFRKNNDKTITFSIDLRPMPSSPGSWVFTARSVLIGQIKQLSREYSEQRISLDKTVWTPSPLNSSLWNTIIVYGNDSRSRRVGVKFASPPLEFNMTQFEVKLKKLVILPGPPRPRPPTKTVAMTVISQNYYEFTDVMPGKYMLYVRANDTRRDPNGKTRRQCLLAGACARCLSTQTGFFEIKEVIQNEESTDNQISWSVDDWTVRSSLSRNQIVPSTSKTKQEKSLPETGSTESGNDAGYDAIREKYNEKVTVVMIAVVIVFGIVEVITIATVCYIYRRRSGKNKSFVRRRKRRTVKSGVEDSDYGGNYNRESEKARSSPSSKGSHEHTHPKSAMADSGVETISQTQEYTKLVPSLSAHCSHHVTGNDVISAAVTLGGGTSAPPEGIVVTRQRPRSPRPYPAAYHVDEDQETWTYTTTSTYEGLGLREEDDVSM